jgi:hypothetical protein
MENQIFRLPAVAAVLKKDFVEARLHMDNPDQETLAKAKAVRELFGGGVATPTFVIVEPNTGQMVLRHEGWIPNEQKFLKFLRGKK